MYDPCPANTPYKQSIFFNGLYGNWKQVNFVNPPYTKLKEFVAKAMEQSDIGKTTFMLLPSKTEQEWFHKIIHAQYSVKWIRKRLKFKNNKHHATQPHFLVMIK